MNVRFRLGFVWLQNLCSLRDNKGEEWEVSMCLSTVITIFPYLFAFFLSLSLGLFLFFIEKAVPSQNYKDWSKYQIMRLFRGQYVILGVFILISLSQLPALIISDKHMASFLLWKTSILNNKGCIFKQTEEYVVITERSTWKDCCIAASSFCKESRIIKPKETRGNIFCSTKHI